MHHQSRSAHRKKQNLSYDNIVLCDGLKKYANDRYYQSQLIIGKYIVDIALINDTKKTHDIVPLASIQNYICEDEPNDVDFVQRPMARVDAEYYSPWMVGMDVFTGITVTIYQNKEIISKKTFWIRQYCKIQRCPSI